MRQLRDRNLLMAAIDAFDVRRIRCCRRVDYSYFLAFAVSGLIFGARGTDPARRAAVALRNEPQALMG